MTVVTRLAPMYSVRTLVMSIVCVVFGIWGAYDLFVKIPRAQTASDAYVALIEEKDDLDARAEAETLTDADRVRYGEIEAALAEIGDAPSPPSTFDRVTQWAFIACLPCAPFFFMAWIRAKRQHYELDDEGTLTTSQGRFRSDQIVDVDMSRWMAKSVAFVVLKSGERIKLDDYIHRDSHLIVGHLASRLHPDEWTEDARPNKGDAGQDAEEAARTAPDQDGVASGDAESEDAKDERTS